MTTLTDQIRHQAESSKLAVLFEDERHTWGDVFAAASERAAFLASQDFSSRGTSAYCSRTCPRRCSGWRARRSSA